MNKKIQILRSIAVFAVVIIHTCPQGILSVPVRPFLNFSVGLFLFLSGYLTKLNIDNPITFCKKRISRVLFPYIIWTLVYTVILGDITVSNLIYNIFTTNACYTLYYIAVYIQLVLITPVLVKTIHSKCHYIYLAIQPLFIILLSYIPNFINKPLPYPFNTLFFGVWFLSYYLGLLLGNKIITIKLSNTKLIGIYIFSILLQICEGFSWYKLDNISMATTQLKFTAIFSTIYFCIIAYKYIENNKSNIKPNKLYNLLISIGDYSFGIFLLHPLLIAIADKISLWKYVFFPINSVIIYILSFICVMLGSKILGKKLGKFIGFN